MEKTCIQCGVILCEKNWFICGKYIVKKCKSCSTKTKSCDYNYNSLELNLFANRMSRNINTRLRNFKKTGRGKRKARLEGRPCVQCGVIICNKNWVLNYFKDKIAYILSKCKACHSNSNSCNYNYESSELQALSKKMLRIITSKLHYTKNITDPNFVKYRRQYSLDYADKNKQRLYEKTRLKNMFRSGRYASSNISRFKEQES